ncbi:MAG TPA: phosphatidate cytidylyltransferase [Phycisphaerae bacterium]|nr:phosphatidate cytidylyltransferase [Phycisphaerae bacterium]
MKHRLLFGALFIATLFALIYADAWWVQSDNADPAPSFLKAIGIWRTYGLFVAIILVALVTLATREMVALVRAAGHAPLATWPILINVLLILVPFAVANRRFDFHTVGSPDGEWTMMVFLIGLFGTCVGVATRKRTDGSMNAIAVTLLIVIYVGLLASFIMRLRVFAEDALPWLLLYFIGTVKACDIGAYFTGRAIGRTKLIEWLSPKKTIEGLAGGVAFSILVAVGVPMIVRALAEPGSQTAGIFPTPGRAVIFGIAMALVGHAGDLLESLFKRDAKAKDSAAAIPAFGGVLDIIDSPLLTAPLAYWLLLK